ncbi:helix-turn-helix domain-containing protein [Methylobacterium sp. Leaf100]|uniref:helix-turn-helix domain-containing protein n=1 Tax=Methylobacterium sp. Leaf100 TaxID=1736252 RepID=UPI0006F45D76|nr:helix-turn-helix domain-containing protein [Methylobacterium sp. Leaf100]KQP26604.1 cyclic nucleotide-binding protein [Methylobacterium sp. Leaf100]
MHLTAQQPLVLLAEANALVGVDLGDALVQAGYRVIGPYATALDALDALERESPVLAVVDVELKDGVCTALGQELRHRGIPCLVHSSLLPNEPQAIGFQGVPWICKPAFPEDLIALLDELAFLPPPSARIEALPVGFARPAETRGNPLVRKLEGFVALSEADRAILERISAAPRIVGPRTDLIREGDTPRGVFLIMDGMACRYKQRRDGARQILAYLLPGDFCDLDAALLSAMDHTISTLSGCRVVHIAPDLIAELMRNHPQLARAMRMTTLVDEATLREWLLNVGRRSALERLAHLFCELYLRMKVVGFVHDESYGLPITQSELADTAGITIVHANRSLQELRRRGLIEMRGRSLKILNFDRLKQLAEFQSAYLHLDGRAAA